MNRRNLFKLLPVLPLAFVPTQVEKKQEVDTRVTYKRSDYVLWEITEQACEMCKGTHKYYTHGCVPGAFPAYHEIDNPVPISNDMSPVPTTVTQNCDVHREWAGHPPHQHNDFYWIN